MLTVFKVLTVQSQSGGDLKIEAFVIANGGESRAGLYELTGTAGQPLAGNVSTGGPYRLTSGFWQATALVPTSAIATVSGRTISAFDRPLGGVNVYLISSEGQTLRSVTNQFGYFQFDTVESGKVYMLSADHRRFTFNSQMIVVNEDLANIVLTAIP